MINTYKPQELIADALYQNIKKAKQKKAKARSCWREEMSKYTMNHCSFEDKPKSRHERRFPSWEKENWD